VAIYNYKCTETNCTKYNEVIERFSFNSSEIMYCNICKVKLLRLFPSKVHVKGKGREVNGKDLGKVTQEKNENLKKKWGGYSYEEQNLRKKINKMTEERVGKK